MDRFVSFRTTAAPLLACAAVASIASPASASPGDLDETFSGDGAVISSDFTAVSDLEAGPNGTVVVVGTTQGETLDVLIARFLANGELDPTFSEDGLAAFDSGADDSGAAAVVDPDGSVVVSGEAGGAFLAARLTPGGQLDPSFDLDGVTIRPDLAPGLAVTRIDAVRLVFASGVKTDDGVRPAAVRLLSDGQPDADYGAQGVAVVDGPDAYGGATLIERLADGSTLVGVRGTLAKLDEAGQLVTSFGEGGRTKPELVFGATGVVERPDGTLLVPYTRTGISLGPGASTGSYLVRYSAAGETRDYGGHNLGNVLESQTPYVSYAAGSGRPDSRGSALPGTIAVHRLNDAFSIDRSFGLRGNAYAYPERLPTSYPIAEALDFIGRPVVVAELEDSRFAIVRLEVAEGPRDSDADGAVDAQDRCPYGFSTRDDGCRSETRSLRLLRPSRGPWNLRVRVSGRNTLCLDGTLELVRHAAGGDEVVSSKPLHGDAESGRPFQARPGRYYAQVPRTKSPVVRCRAARSNTVRIR